jgi:PHD/YefM family antitoxin component YafN of YafNO toxin-antitoxin module
MKRVKSAELVRSVSRYSDYAVTEPVLITRHGHDRLVLLSADTYYKLLAAATESSRTLDRRTSIGRPSECAMVAARPASSVSSPLCNAPRGFPLALCLRPHIPRG